jgi:uncharacterized delta-60 repeat protein
MHAVRNNNPKVSPSFLSAILFCGATMYGTFCLTQSAQGETSVQAWAQRYSNAVDSNDWAKRVTTDADGNVIVVGYTDDRMAGGQDMLVIKYSAVGTALWTNRYDGPAHQNDHANDVAADASGNVFVTGHSTGSGGNLDFATIAYSSVGQPLWTNRYNGPANSADQAVAVRIDGVGGVIVSGYSFGTGYDYATIKYSGAGVPLWTNRYNGPGNNEDEPTALAVDNAGNVFVTGYSYSGTIYDSSDFATVAYSSSGIALWTNRYNGSGNYHDSANAVAVDTGGNVFVTGSAYEIGTGFDYVTIKYSAVGAPLWTNRYNGSVNGADSAYALAIDSNGDVLVTGSSYDNASAHDYATIKYSSAGVPLWTNRYSSPDAISDSAYALGVDGDGNVVVTGTPATIMYSSAGAQLWTNDAAITLAVANNGNVFVTTPVYTGSAYDWLTTAYSGSGAPLWTNRYNGVGNADDQVSAVVVDKDGNVIVTGSSVGKSTTFPDFATIKFSSAGLPLWTNRYNAPGNSEDRAVALAVHTNGDVFVTGYSWGSGGTYYDFVTVAYSSAGVPLWTNRYNGPLANGEDRAAAIAVDSNGNVFVTGASTGSGGVGFDYVTIKYSAAGLPLWTNRYIGPGNDYPTSIAVYTNGDVIVSGYSGGIGYDYATIKYSGAGVPLWTNRYNGPGNNMDYAAALAVDADGNTIVTGYTSTSTTTNSRDYATIKYSSTGLPLWTNRYNGPNNREDAASAVAVDTNGNIFVTGFSYPNSEALPDFATIKYSSAGLPLWTNRYDGPVAGDDRATGVAVDSSGNIFVSGSSPGIGSTNDFATIKYSNNGVALWTNRYNGPANGVDSPDTKFCIAVTPGGAVHVAGASDGNATSTTNFDYAVVKYVTVSPILLDPLSFTNSSFGFSFTNTPGAGFTVFASTNAALPLSAWSNLGPAVESPAGSGQFHFTDFQVVNYLWRFYLVSGP